MAVQVAVLVAGVAVLNGANVSKGPLCQSALPSNQTITLASNI
jgi:hypothetical protein